MTEIRNIPSFLTVHVLRTCVKDDLNVTEASKAAGTNHPAATLASIHMHILRARECNCNNLNYTFNSITYLHEHVHKNLSFFESFQLRFLCFRG